MYNELLTVKKKDKEKSCRSQNSLNSPSAQDVKSN